MNENHRRVMTVYLYTLEKNLDCIREELQNSSSEADHVLYTVRRDVKESERAALSQAISSMLDEIRTMKLSYELQPENESSKNRINGALLEISNAVNDLRPKALERYGPLTVQDGAKLNSYISQLQNLLDEAYSSLSWQAVRHH